MSLWLQTAVDCILSGEYEHLKKYILPTAPISLTSGILNELNFGERKCSNNNNEMLFPIRMLWLWDANEQRLFGLAAQRRSLFHPEKLISTWEKVVSGDEGVCLELENAGLKLDFEEKAILTDHGWVFIGNDFIQDFLDIEKAMGVDMEFADDEGTYRPIFRNNMQV